MMTMMAFRREEVGQCRHNPDRTTVTSSRPTRGGPIAFWNWGVEHAGVWVWGEVDHQEKKEKKRNLEITLTLDITVPCIPGTNSRVGRVTCHMYIFLR